MPVISKITVPGDNTYDIKDNSKLPKTTYEWNKEVSMSGSGYVKIGSFPMYDTNITINIDATTSSTYHGTVLIATQNVSTTSMGSAHNISVYGDPTGTIASALRIVWTSGSRNYDIYFVPQAWSKNFIHIRGIGQYLDGATDICTKVSSGSPPSTTSGLEPKNMFEPPYFGNGLASCSTAEATVAKLASLSGYILHDHGIVSVKFTNAVPANSTLNINSKGAKSIYYQGSAITDDVIKAGDVATFIYSTQYHLIAIDRWGKYIDEVNDLARNAITTITDVTTVKNRIPINFKTTTFRNVTYTNNGDGTITVSGTPSSASTDGVVVEDATSSIVEAQSTSTLIDIPSGKYFMSWGVDGPKSYVWVSLYRHDGTGETLPFNILNGTLGYDQEFTYIRSQTQPYLGIRITQKADATEPMDFTFKPMLCTKAEWDISDAFVPYAKTNRELTVENDSQQSEINYAVNAGAKNFGVPFNPTSTTDITVTRNADGSYTFVCTNVASNSIIRVANIIEDLPSGSYTFSGTTGGSSSTYMLGLYNTSSTAVKYQHTNTEETYTGNVSGFSLRVRIISGYSGTFTVYPMLRPSAITDPTFQPYAKTNSELTMLYATSIPKNADLNDYTTGGIYSVASSTIAATILHAPASNYGYILEVFSISDNTKYQRIIIGSDIYTRRKQSSGWQSWYKFAGTEVT